jgi:hypothetical protein
MSRPPRIQLRIDRISIDQALLAGERPHEVEAAIQRSLQELLATTRSPMFSSARQIDDAGPQPLPPARSGVTVGERVAAAVYDSLVSSRSGHGK